MPSADFFVHCKAGKRDHVMAAFLDRGCDVEVYDDLPATWKSDIMLGCRIGRVPAMQAMQAIAQEVANAIR